jgi:hypothetical protein
LWTLSMRFHFRTSSCIRHKNRKPEWFSSIHGCLCVKWNEPGEGDSLWVSNFKTNEQWDSLYGIVASINEVS